MAFAGAPRYASAMTERTESDPPDPSSEGDTARDRRGADEAAPTTVTPKATRGKAGDPAAAGASAAITTDESAAGSPPSVINIERGGLDVARAERVSVNRGGITTVDATTVDLKQGGISRVTLWRHLRELGTAEGSS